MHHIDQMLPLAKQAVANAYCPYSNFPVVCVLRTDDEQYFVGVNMENASFPEGICAEATALGTMITQGVRKVTEVLIYAGQDVRCFPCGGCRQRLAEFCTKDVPVHIANAHQGYLETHRFADIMPHSFTVDTMQPASL